MRLVLRLAALTVALFLARPASAHLDLVEPTSRYDREAQKVGPCGLPDGQRSTNVTYVEPGATIEVRWEEYVDHPGHFRIAFDDDGDDDFVDPPTMMATYSNDAVLLDDIVDRDGDEGAYVVEVTLPDITCDNCTLQVIQVMYDKPPYTLPGDDIYYQCADLVLREGGAPGPGDPDAGIDPGPGGSPAAGSAGAGCSATGAAPTVPWWLAAIGLLGIGRRLARGWRLRV